MLSTDPRGPGGRRRRRRAALLAVAAAALGAVAPLAPASARTATPGPTGRSFDDANGQKALTLVWFVRGEQLQPAVRRVRYDRTILKQVLHWLEKGPGPAEARRHFETAFLPGFHIRNVRYRNGVAIVYVPAGINAPAGAMHLSAVSARRLRIAQIVYTLTEYPDVHTVTIVTPSANGRKQQRLRGLNRATFAAPAHLAPQLPLPPWQGPRYGDIRSIQEGLVKVHFLGADGVSGESDYRTQQALLAFQAWTGLDRSGVVTKDTVKRLRRMSKPPAPRTDGSGHRIEVYRDLGVALAIDGDEVVRAIHVSTGAGGRTPSGSFSIFRKELNSWSVPFSVNLPYASYFSGGMAFHAYPDVPAYPASHGCIRVSSPEAHWLYDFTPYGTPVRIY